MNRKKIVRECLKMVKGKLATMLAVILFMSLIVPILHAAPKEEKVVERKRVEEQAVDDLHVIQDQIGAIANIPLDTDNPGVSDVESAFNRINSHGVKMAVNSIVILDGIPIVPWGRYTGGKNHFQGIQRLKNHYIAITGSDDQYTSHLFIVQLGTKQIEGQNREIFRSNVLNEDGQLRTVPLDPQIADRVIKRIDLDPTGHYWHAGGMALLGDILAIPLESEDDSKIVFYDVSDPTDTRPILGANGVAMEIIRESREYNLPLGDLYVSRKAGLTLLTKLDNGYYLLGVWSDGDKITMNIPHIPEAYGNYIDFYFSTSPNILEFDSNCYITICSDNYKGDQSGSFPQIRECDNDEAGQLNFSGQYQTINFVKQTDGQLYMVATFNTGVLGSGIGEDWVDLLKFDYDFSNPDYPTGTVTKVASKKKYCDDTGLPVPGRDEWCNFQAAASIYINNANELTLYSVNYYINKDDFLNDDDKTQIPFTEFRSIDPVSYIYSSEDAWIYLYDGKDFSTGERSWMIDYIDHGKADYSDYHKINRVRRPKWSDYNFNDRVTSVKWQLPVDHEYALFEHTDYDGDALVLIGNGTVQFIDDLRNINTNQVQVRFIGNRRNYKDKISSSKTISESSPNSPPFVSATAIPSPAPTGATVCLDASGSVDDDMLLTFLWTQRKGSPVTLSSITNAIATFIAPGTPQTMQFKVTVTDSTGISSERIVTVVINENAHIRRPDLLPTAIQFNPEDLIIGNQIIFDSGVQNAGDKDSKDFNIEWFVDNEQVGYGSHQAVHAGETVLDGNSQLSWTVVAGTHTIKFKVDVDNHNVESNEANNEVSETVTIPTNPNNSPPKILNKGAAPTTITEGEEYYFNVNAEDDDLDNITFSFSNAPGDMVIDSYTGEITWNAPAYNPGGSNTYAVTVLVSDGQNTDSDQWTITVQSASIYQADLQPTAITYLPIDITAGDIVTFDTQVKNNGNADSGIFNVKWTIDGQDIGAAGSHANVPAGQTVDDNSFLDWPAVAGSHTVKFVVDYDNKVDESNETNNIASIQITVAEPPVLKADLQPTPITHLPIDITAGDIVTFDTQVKNNGNADSGIFNVKWTIDGQDIGAAGSHANVPAGQTVDDNSFLGWTAVAGSHTIAFIVDHDNRVDESNETNNVAKLIIMNIPENNPPIAQAIASPGTASAGDLVTLLSGSTDPDGDAMSYNWSQIGGTPTVTLEIFGAGAKFTAPEVSIETILTFELIVTDSHGASDTATVSVTILASQK